MESFKRALLILEGHQVIPAEAAQIYHLKGMCYMSQDLLQQVPISSQFQGEKQLAF